MPPLVTLLMSTSSKSFHKYASISLSSVKIGLKKLKFLSFKSLSRPFMMSMRNFSETEAGKMSETNLSKHTYKNIFY